MRRQKAQRIEREKERAELLTQRDRRLTRTNQDSTTDRKPRWGTPEAREEAMIELQRRIEKSREQGGKKKQDSSGLRAGSVVAQQPWIAQKNQSLRRSPGIHSM